MEGLRTAPSKIQGTGCFAEKGFAKDERLGEYTGELISDAEAMRRHVEGDHTYLFAVEDDLCIDARFDDTNILKYINHSCEPNCYAECEGHRIFIYALRDIERGEELTYDYQLVCETDEALTCSCGSKSCRGTMRATQD